VVMGGTAVFLSTICMLDFMIYRASTSTVDITDVRVRPSSMELKKQERRAITEA